jgi:hypothetical protein
MTANITIIISIVALGVSVEREIREVLKSKTKLAFALHATNIPADEEDRSNMFFDGTPVVRALSMTATNIRGRPITIAKLECSYSLVTRDGGGDRPR